MPNCRLPRLLLFLFSVWRRRTLVGRPPLARVLLPLLPLPRVFGVVAEARTQGGQSARLLLPVVTGTRSLLVVALPLLPGREEAASEARVFAQRS